jgi:hypothetical protein
MWTLQEPTSETFEVGDTDPGESPGSQPANTTNRRLRARIRFCKPDLF